MSTGTNGSGGATAPEGPSGGTLSGIAAVLVIVGIFFAVLMGSMDSLIVATVLPAIAGDLHQSTGVAFVVGAYLIASTIAIPIFARLSDLGSRRNVFLAGIAIFMAGSVLAGLSQNLTELVLFRGIQGFGGGGIFPVAIAMVAVLFPPRTRARVTGVLSGAAGIAIVLGPLVGSAIVTASTWRWVFYINLPFGALAAVVLLAAVEPLRGRASGGFDLPGAGLLSAWVGALMFALVQVSNAGWAWTDPRILGLLVSSAVLFAVFLVWELRHPAPLIPLRLLRERVVGSSGGGMLFLGVALNALLTFLSVFVGIVLLGGGSAASADVRDILYFLAIPLILGAALGSQLLTRLPYRAVIVPSLVIAGLAALPLAAVTPGMPLWVLAWGVLPDGGLALPLIPVGFGLGVATAGITIILQNEAPRSGVGAVIGLTRFLQNLGGAVGLSLLTAFETWRYGELSSGLTSPASLAGALTTTYGELFLAIAVCILLAATFALGLTGRMPSTPAEDPERGGAGGIGSPGPASPIGSGPMPAGPEA
jgi:MFS family permease